MLYSVKVNAALSAMDIPPNTIAAGIRKQGMEEGKRAQLGHRETALLIVATAYGMGYPETEGVLTIVQEWTDDKKIDLDHPLVVDALKTIRSAK